MTGRARFVTLACLILCGVTQMEAPAFLKLEGIDGESKTDGHENWITLDSVQFGMIKFPGARPDFNKYALLKRTDKATPAMLQAVAEGAVIPLVELDLTDSSQQGETYLKYKLRNVIITSYSMTEPTGDAVPEEKFNLDYTLIEMAHWQRRIDGILLEQVSSFWDIPSNTGEFVVGNDPPTIDPIADVRLLPGETRELIAIVNDNESPPSELPMTADSDGFDLIKDLTVTGADAKRTVSFRASSLYSGATSINLHVSDGVNTTTRSFGVLIDVEMTPFEAYMMANFTAEELADPQIASPIGDPDKDDIPTIVEFMLITNPNEFTPPHHAITVSREDSDSEGRVKVQFRRRTDQPVITGRVYHSVDYETWNELVPGGSAPPYSEETTPGDTFWEWVTGTLIVPPGSPDTNAFRIQVETE